MAKKKKKPYMADLTNLLKFIFDLKSLSLKTIIVFIIGSHDLHVNVNLNS